MPPRRRPSRRTAPGLALDLEGFDEFVEGLAKGRKELPDVYRAVLRGPGGEAIASEVRQRMPRKTGATALSVEVQDRQRDGVEIGPNERDHPRSRRPFQLIGRLIESGAKAHTIKARRGGLAGAVGFRKEVPHPGFRGRRTMSRSLKHVRWEVEAALVDELTTRRWAQEGP